MQRFSFFLFLFFTLVSANATEIRIAVSDLIADHISETVEMLAAEGSVDISVISTGSLPAMDSLRSDEISLAIIAAPETMDSVRLPKDTYETFTIAYGTAVVAVNSANPINEVSFDELQGIFCPDSSLSIETWDALGVESLANRSIKALVKQDETSVATELFRHTALQGEKMKPTVNELIGSEIEETLASNIAAVAIVPYLPDNEKVKALMISIDSESPAFGPTNDNVYFGDYPISLPFQIVYKKDREAELSEVLRILLSDEVTEMLRENHLFVPPDALRMSFLNRLRLIE